MKNTKETILEIALEQFSQKGYEATSMADIANAVGIKKASLYAHYSCKQDILNILLNMIDDNYQKNSIFSNIVDYEVLRDADKAIKIVEKQINYIISDPYVSQIRKLFTIEQYRNDRLAYMQQKYSYDNVMDFGVKLVKYLINENIFIQGDVEAMASQFVLPISMWISMCDRDAKNHSKVKKLIRKHIVQFYKTYSI